jgi:hypothetical protein
MKILQSIKILLVATRMAIAGATIPSTTSTALWTPPTELVVPTAVCSSTPIELDLYYNFMNMFRDRIFMDEKYARVSINSLLDRTLNGLDKVLAKTISLDPGAVPV